MSSRLYSTDIGKIFKNYEPSKLKMWEIARSFHPLDFSKLLYLLENVTVSSRRSTIALDDSLLNYNVPHDVDDADNDDGDDDDGNTNTIPDILILTDTPSIRLERSAYEMDDVFWNDNIASGRADDDDDDDDDDVDIDTLLNYIRSNNFIQQTSSDQIVTSSSSSPSPSPPSSSFGQSTTARDLRFRVLNHNIGTSYYHSFVKHVEFLLFNDNFQYDRNEYNSQHTSIVLKFMQFYKTINFKESLNNDARNFRNIIVRKPQRIYVRDDVDSDRYIVQPLYQGFHVVVYSSPTETKCYSRYGSLHANLAYSIRCSEPCTFEAIILPIDKFNNPRCWRYWTFRSGFVMYIVDVFRYKQTILTSNPFKERIKYIDLIVRNQPDILRSSIRKTHTWLSIESAYVEARDLYDPIVGVVLRDPNYIISPRNASTVAASAATSMPKAFEPKAFYFNILYSYDILQSKIVKLDPTYPLSIVRTLHLSYEMADYKTICVAYGHCDRFIYLCTYDRNLQQFVHAARLQRSPMEYTKLLYKPDRIFVVNHKTIPRGVLYLRVYYDLSKNIIGYEQKHTDDRFNLPYTNPLLNSLKNINC
nr:gp48-like protein [Oryctes rhinoceros nudivirus]